MPSRMQIAIISIIMCLFPFLLNSTAAETKASLYKKSSELINKGRYKKAVSVLLSLLEEESISNDTLSKIYNNLGFCHHMMNLFDEAVKYYFKSLSINEKYPRCLNNVAASYMKMGQYSEAIPFLEKALSFDESNIKVLFNLFVCYAHQNKEMPAKIYLKRAFTLDNEYTQSRLRRNRISNRHIRKIQDYVLSSTEDS